MPSPLPFRIFNSFTTTPFSGNPGAVYVFPQDERGSDNATLMLNIAREHNLSETGFLVPRPADGDSVVTYGLRWFTPTVEFPLCGHVTLGSAHVLFAEHHPDAEKLRFETMSGTLFATRLDDGRIELDFPADVSVVEEVDELLEEDLLDKLVLVNASLAANVVRIKKGKIAWIVEVKEDFDLETAALTVAPLRDFDGYFVFTQPGGQQHPSYDIYSRVFDPVEPNPEDSVTGSAHCMLAPYWLSVGHSRLANSANLLKTKTLRALQGGKDRQGDLQVQWDVASWRAKLRGSVVTVMEGTLLV